MDDATDASDAGPDRAPMGWPDALTSRRAKLEPFDWYDRRRDEGPIHYDPDRGCWDVFGYDLAIEILTDPEAFSSVTRPPDQRTPLPSMLSTDPPEHGDLREPVESFFTPGAARSLEPEVERTAASLLDEGLDDALDDGSDADDPELDVVDDLAWPLPIATIAALLGIPDEDRAQFKAWSDAVIAGPALTGGDPDVLERRRQEAAGDLASYFADVCRERRDHPRDDLVSQVLQETDLSDMALLGLFRLLLVAGNVTTTNLITNAVRCLTGADAREQTTDGSGPGRSPLARVRNDRSLLRPAIEETLRHRSPVQRTVRRATRDLELGGREVASDDRVVVWLGAANRDPAVFDDPDTFRLDRSPNPHVAFGRGIHVCLGAPLARLEAEIALAALLDRTDALEPVECRYEPVASTFIYGVRHFPVRIA